MDIVTKICTRCKESKAVDEFYSRSGAPHLHYNVCKECFRAGAKTRRPLGKLVASTDTEHAVIQQLIQRGIPAVPGKSLAHRYADIIAWGCVMVEVKSSTLHPNDIFQFGFTGQQQNRGLRGDLVVLVCQYDDCNTYHVFPSDHAIFYRNGQLKTATCYMLNPKHRKFRQGVTQLTDELMTQHQDAWHLVEERRLQVQRRLMAGEEYPLIDLSM